MDLLGAMFDCGRANVSKLKVERLLEKNNKDVDKVIKKIKINKKYYKGVLMGNDPVL